VSVCICTEMCFCSTGCGCCDARTSGSASWLPRSSGPNLSLSILTIPKIQTSDPARSQVGTHLETGLARPGRLTWWLGIGHCGDAPPRLANVNNRFIRAARDGRNHLLIALTSTLQQFVHLASSSTSEAEAIPLALRAEPNRTLSGLSGADVVLGPTGCDAPSAIGSAIATATATAVLLPLPSQLCSETHSQCRRRRQSDGSVQV